MIRTRTEYADALSRLADEQARLAEDRARLKSAGLTDDDIQNFVGPLEAIRQHLAEEVEEYERARVAVEQVSPSADTPSEVPPLELSTPAAASPTIFRTAEAVAPKAAKPVKRKVATRSKVKSKSSSSPTSDTLGTPTPSTKSKTTKSKGESMPRRKGLKFGPSSSNAPKKSAGKETRRKFSLDDKRRILAEIASAPHGSRGKIVEKYGLYSPTLADWRRLVGKSGRAGAVAGASASATRKVGRPAGRPRSASNGVAGFDSSNLVDIVRENSALRAEVAALRSRMDQVKRFVQIQRQLAEQMLGLD